MRNTSPQLSQLRLFQMISPSLPIGAFTYSQGLEWAVENGWVRNEKDTQAWLLSTLDNSLARLELPVMQRMHQALQENSTQDFFYWSEFVWSYRETSELRAEETQRALAFFEILRKLPRWTGEQALQTHRDALLLTQIADYTLAGYHWQIDVKELMAGLAWSWLENAVNSAIKLVPLGQSAGQSLLFELSEQIPALIDSACALNNEQLGPSTPALAIASSRHETQYCRLFRS
ncbi:MAG: urease accessory protein UreF [Gammaproteobacteria bacterium]|nr:urease accessory protein UreF [Gammaproteobacteria bacterium]